MASIGRHVAAFGLGVRPGICKIFQSIQMSLGDVRCLEQRSFLKSFIDCAKPSECLMTFT